MNEQKKPAEAGMMAQLTWKGKMLLAALETGLLHKNESGGVDVPEEFERFCELSEYLKNEEVHACSQDWHAFYKRMFRVEWLEIFMHWFAGVSAGIAIVALVLTYL